MLKAKGSLARRNAFVYFVLFLIGISVTGIVLFSYSSREILDLTEKRLTHTAEMIRLKMMDYTNHLERDINQLASSPLLERYSEDTTGDNLDVLTQEYISVLASKPNFFQIRLIEANNLGKEIIRVERKKDKLLTTPKNELQYKGDRDYFQELSDMPLDSLYYSEINLNREHTQISDPRIPTLRMGKRLKANRLGEMILIVNIDLNKIFAELEQLLPESYELRVLNHDGHYLIHPDVAATFTFEYDRKSVFHEEFDSREYLQEDGQWKDEFQTSETIVSRIEIPYGREHVNLQAMVSAKKSIILSSFYSWRNKVLFLILGVAIVFLLLAFVYMRRQSSELNRITAQLSSFANEPTPMNLPIKRKDEIGELASSFELMSRKISESQQLLEEAREKAEEAYAEKNMFLENMSHEIRNPLQAIIGTTEILEQNKMDPAQQPFISSLKFSATQLKSLVTDILDYGKIKAGQIKIDPEWNRLDTFCQELIQSLGHLAQRKNIKLTLAFPTEFQGEHFKYDPLRLYQILNNLLNNALKFTPEKGQIILTVSLAEKEKIKFAVSDNGPGMPEEELKRILNRNYTSDYSTGAGLGLTIVKELLHLQNSELTVISNEGKGSEFNFELAIETRQDESGKNDQFEMSPIDSQNLSILIIEDDPELRNWYGHIFNAYDCEILANPSLIPAEKMWLIIITDLNFESEGIVPEDYTTSLTKKLQSGGQVLVVSGNDINAIPVSDDKVQRLAKPVDREILMRKIHRIGAVAQFGKPDFNQIEKDYDQVVPLIQNAMGILIEEWEKDTQRYKEAILNRDIEKFDAITHKILASVKRFKLDKLNQLLESVRLSLSAQDDKHEGWQQKLDEAMLFIVSEMRVYRQALK